MTCRLFARVMMGTAPFHDSTEVISAHRLLRFCGSGGTELSHTTDTTNDIMVSQPPMPVSMLK